MNEPTTKELLQAIHDVASALDGADKRNVALTNGINSRITSLEIAIMGPMDKPRDGFGYRLARIEDRFATLFRVVWVVVGVAATAAANHFFHVQ